MRILSLFFSLVLVSACGSSQNSGLNAEAGDALRPYRNALNHLQKLPAVQGLSPEEMATRVEACWKNPLGDDLSENEKAFYCQFPLEFRLCNSPVLLATKAEPEKHYALRVKGYQECKKITGFTKLLASEDVDQLYSDLFLRKGRGLNPEDVEKLAAGVRPSFSSRPFAELRNEVALELAEHAFRNAIKGIQNQIMNVLHLDHESSDESIPSDADLNPI